MILNSPITTAYYSLCSYLDHQILNKGQAYTNYGSLFYPIKDVELPNRSVYGAPFKQFVYDSSVSGAYVPSGVYINNNFIAKGTSGLMIDHWNGRAILDSGNYGLTVSGNYSVKDFNIYPSTKSDEQLLYETKYQINPSFNRQQGPLDKEQVSVPGLFITNSNFFNDGYSFGGLQETTINIHCLALAESKDALDVLGGLLVDEKFNYYNVVNQTPLNYFGDLKSDPYNYTNYVNQNPTNILGYIADSDFYKISNRDFSNRYSDLRVGVCDLQVKLVRYTNKY